MGFGGGFRAVQRSPSQLQLQQMSAARDRANKEAAMAREEAARNKVTLSARPGIKEYAQSAQEKKAGVSPVSFEGMRDLKTGELLADYKFDPYAGEAVQALKGEAFGTSKDSPWLKLQREREMQGMDQAAKAGLQGMSQAQAQLAMTGGISGGARERMARMGAKDLMLAKQGITREGTQARLGRQGELLGSFADLERQAQSANIDTRKQALAAQAEFDANRYNQQMSAYGAKQAADAQRASAPKAGKCFSGQTAITMADGSTKEIRDIQVGDEVLKGGKVLEVVRHEDEHGLKIFNYHGALVTGSHAVREFGRWERVENSEVAKDTFIKSFIVYNLVTEKHVIISNGVIFSDNVETEENYKNENMSLAALNGMMF